MYFFFFAVVLIVGILLGYFSASYRVRAGDSERPPAFIMPSRTHLNLPDNFPFIDFVELEKYNSDEYVAELEQLELDKQLYYRGRRSK